jgi:hypothetical protein
LIVATGQTIGLLVRAAMASKTRDVESVFGDFKRCLNSYETWAESYYDREQTKGVELSHYDPRGFFADIYRLANEA